MTVQLELDLTAFVDFICTSVCFQSCGLAQLELDSILNIASIYFVIHFHSHKMVRLDLAAIVNVPDIYSAICFQSLEQISLERHELYALKNCTFDNPTGGPVTCEENSILQKHDGAKVKDI